MIPYAHHTERPDGSWQEECPMCPSKFILPEDVSYRDGVWWNAGQGPFDSAEDAFTKASSGYKEHVHEKHPEEVTPL